MTPFCDITWVIRAAGERTLDACAATLRAQVGPEAAARVHIIHERPFENAVRRTFELGLEEGRLFTVGLDADALLVSRGAERLAELAAALKPEQFSAVGLMLCRFYGGFCFRGAHVYRTSLIPRARPLLGRTLPDGPPADLKPESAVVHAMAQAGHGFVSLPLVLAVHDYEQSYRHVYLKMRLRARREADHDPSGRGLATLRAFCAEQAAREQHDFTVALWGLDDGWRDAQRDGAGGCGTPRTYDWFAPWPELDARMAALGLREKPPLAPGDAAGLADALVSAHALGEDVRTPSWIRDHLLARRAA